MASGRVWHRGGCAEAVVVRFFFEGDEGDVVIRDVANVAQHLYGDAILDQQDIDVERGLVLEAMQRQIKIDDLASLEAVRPERRRIGVGRDVGLRGVRGGDALLLVEGAGDGLAAFALPLRAEGVGWFPLFGKGFVVGQEGAVAEVSSARATTTVRARTP